RRATAVRIARRTGGRSAVRVHTEGRTWPTSDLVEPPSSLGLAEARNGERARAWASISRAARPGGIGFRHVRPTRVSAMRIHQRCGPALLRILRSAAGPHLPGVRRDEPLGLPIL